MGKTTVGMLDGNGKGGLQVFECTPTATVGWGDNNLYCHAVQLPAEIPLEKIRTFFIGYCIRQTGTAALYMDTSGKIWETAGYGRPESDAAALERLRKTGVILSHRLQSYNEITAFYSVVVVCAG